MLTTQRTVLLEKLTAAQLSFTETLRFITVFTKPLSVPYLESN
jgi:hypothetical protein